MIIATTEMMTAVERAETNLRSAIATGTERQVDRAAKQLEAARESEARRIVRAKDKLDAQIAVDAQKREAERIERVERADLAEALLRELTPTVTFECLGKRAVVYMSMPGLERTWAVECVRRLAWASSKAFSERVTATRTLGAVAAEQDWLSPLLDDQSHGVEQHIKRGVCRVEEIV